MLLERLAVKQVASCDIFTGQPIKTAWGRLYGGQAVAQCLLAACATVEPRLRVHSLHGYFLLAGTLGTEILFEVDRVRDGRSFATRSVKALQENRCIFQLVISFHREEEGPSFQIPFRDLRASLVHRHVIAPGSPSVPLPEELVARGTEIESHNGRSWVQIMMLGEGDRWNLRWCRYNEEMPSDASRSDHCAVMAYMSDMALSAPCGSPTSLTGMISLSR